MTTMPFYPLCPGAGAGPGHDAGSYHDKRDKNIKKSTEIAYLSIVPRGASAHKNGSQKRSVNATRTVDV